jgi:hypothetical protein
MLIARKRRARIPLAAEFLTKSQPSGRLFSWIGCLSLFVLLIKKAQGFVLRSVLLG